MKYLILPGFFFFLVLSLPCQSQGVRRLLLFAGDSTDLALKTQREWLQADSAGVEKRGIWIAVFTNPKAFRRMYEHHGATHHAFTLVLMGKDGEEKLRSGQPVSTKELFDFLDSLPVPQSDTESQRRRAQNE